MFGEINQLHPNSCILTISPLVTPIDVRSCTISPISRKWIFVYAVIISKSSKKARTVVCHSVSVAQAGPGLAAELSYNSINSPSGPARHGPYSSDLLWHSLVNINLTHNPENISSENTPFIYYCFLLETSPFFVTVSLCLFILIHREGDNINFPTLWTVSMVFVITIVFCSSMTPCWEDSDCSGSGGVELGPACEAWLGWSPVSVAPACSDRQHSSLFWHRKVFYTSFYWKRKEELVI